MCREGWTGQKAGLDEDGSEEDDDADADANSDSEEGGAEGVGAVASDWL